MIWMGRLKLYLTPPMLQGYFDLNKLLVDASSNLRHGSILMFGINLLVYQLIVGPVQLIHALFKTGVKSPEMHFDFGCWVCFAVHLSYSLPLSLYYRTFCCFWTEVAALSDHFWCCLDLFSCYQTSNVQISCFLGVQMSFLSSNSWSRPHIF